MLWKTFAPNHAVFRAMCVLTLAIAGCARSREMLSFSGISKGEAENESANIEDSAEEESVVTDSQKFSVQLALAITAEKSGNSEKAAHIYETMLKNGCRYPQVCHRLAILHDKNGNVERARELYTQALEIEPNNADILCDIAYSHYLRGEMQDAQAMLGRAIEISPNFPRAHNLYGMILARSGHPDVAMTAFRRAGLSESAAHANLAVALTLQGDVASAQDQYRTALHQDPNFEPAKRGLRLATALRQGRPATNAH